MYLEHFGLKAKPFQISADPKFLWMGSKHKEALAILKYGIFDNRGFLLLSGDVGTGKTTLIHALTQDIGSDTVVATVPDPGLSLMDFYRYIAKSFGIKEPFETKQQFLEVFETFLLRNESMHKKVLLIIDEAQRLTSDLLEEIRLLSNIEKDYTKLLNIFFVGQNEFNDIILKQKNRPLRQRITINYNIDPLEQHEVMEYINFRLSVAGCDEPLFTGDAVREVFAFSEGYPRLINIVCDHALLTGFVQGVARITGSIVSECAEELRIHSVTPAPPPPPGAISRGHRRTAALGDDDFSGLRDFHAGDPPRHVAWKTYARSGELKSKRFSGEAASLAWLELRDAPGRDLEERLSVLCRWILDAEKQGRHYGVRLGAETIEPSRGEAHRRRCLDALALYRAGQPEGGHEG